MNSLCLMAIWHDSEYVFKHRVLSHARDSYRNMHIKLFNANNERRPLWHGNTSQRICNAGGHELFFLVVSCSLAVYCDRPVSQN